MPFQTLLPHAIAISRPPSFTILLCRFLSSNCSQALATHEETCSLVLQRCVEASRLDHGRAVHAKLVKQSLLDSVFIHNHLLNMYFKLGDLANGLQLFDEMHERNVVSWSAAIAGLVQHGRAVEALSLFIRVYSNGMKPNEYTLVSALNACSFVGNSIHAYMLYALVVRFGFGPNVFLLNAFVTALIRHGKMVEAFKAFGQCPNKDIVSWNALMAGYLQHCYSEVPGFWYQMNREGVVPDSFTFASVLTALAALLNVKMGMQIHTQLVKRGHGVEICVGNSLVDMYLKNKNLDDGFKAFCEMTCRDVVSWTEMASGCLQCGSPGKALEVIEEMKKTGVKLNKFTLATALNACANLASLEKGKKAHALRIKLGSEADVCVDNALLDMYVKCGCLDGALGVFQLMDSRSVVSWTTMIMGYGQNGQAWKAIELFEEMRLVGVEPNYITFICVLYACSQGGFIEEGWKYFSSMSREHGISPGEDHYACMVDLLGRAGCIKEAEEIIMGMPFQPSVLTWQILLGACRIHGDVETGFRAAKQALDQVQDDPSTYVLLSNIFAGLSNWDGVGMLRELMETRDVKKMPGSSWIELDKNRLPPSAIRGFL